ncbi:MAG: NUDIX domain-containing protein [Bacteroidota bacterium]
MTAETYPVKTKVLAYLTRQQHGKRQLLIFSHRDFPEAGLQVPGGSVEPDEDLQTAVLREVAEESGLTEFSSIAHLGERFFVAHDKGEIHQRHFFHLMINGQSPDRFLHHVSAGEADQGLAFQYEWFDLGKVPALAVEQDAMLTLLR